MLYLLSSIFFLNRNKKRYSVSKYLFFLLFFSSVSAFCVGRQHSFETEALFYVVYICLLTCFLLYSYRNYSNLKSYDFTDVSSKKIATFENIISVLGFVLLFVDSFLLYKIFSSLLSGSIDLWDFKNEGGYSDFVDNLVPHILITYGYLVNPLGYIFLTLHFYYLVLNRKKRSLKYLLLSSILVLNGFITLSRSAAVVYMLLYMGLFWFLLPLINPVVKKSIAKVLAIGIILMSFLFITISNNRFSEYYTKESKNIAILDEKENPVLFSLLDYFSMWQENSIEYLRYRKSNQIYWGTLNEFGIIELILNKKYGADVRAEKQEKEFSSKLDRVWFAFHGPVARMVYNWGYIGTILLVFLYTYFIRKLEPQKGVLSFKNMLAITTLLPIGTMFFVGEVTAGLAFNLAMIYNPLFYYYLKNKSIKAVKKQ